MARTYTQIRQFTARETGLFWISGTADSDGSSTTILRSASLVRWGDNRLNGSHLLLTSGSPSFTELLITDSFQVDGDAQFRPELSAVPDSLTFEILPFSGTDFLYAVQGAILDLYDTGYLSRDLWMRMVGGSPIYNADWSYWTSATAVDGWTSSGTTLARERASGNLGLGETAVAMTAASGTLTLDAQYARYLYDFRGDAVTLYCWVRTSAASTARLNLFNGSNNFSSYHGGDGDWELLHVEVSTVNTDTALHPVLVTDTTTTAFFGMPWVRGGPRIRAYPFPHQIMPDGPHEITTSSLNVDENEIASGRGLGTLRQLDTTSRALIGGRVVKHHDENSSDQIALLDFSQSRRPPSDEIQLWLRGNGPLTVPSSALATDLIEVTESESMLLAKAAAVRLLEQAAAGAPTSLRNMYNARIEMLEPEIEMLKGGVGESRDIATYGLHW